LISLLTLSPIVAAELSIKIIPENKEKVALGESLDATIQIWPTHQLAEKKYLIFEGQLFLDTFYVVSLYEQQVNPNNADVWEARVMLSFARRLAKEEINKKKLWGNDLKLVYDNWMDSLTERAPEVKEYQFVKNDFQLPIHWRDYFWIILLSFILMLVVAWFARKTYLKKRKEKLLEEKRVGRVAFWSDKFESARERSDYEFIGEQSREWVELVGGPSVPIQDFLTLLNEHQFRPQWDEGILEEIELKFNDIREMFK
jgi:hypothetical protein